MAAAGHADHVVDLHLAAGADAQIALDAGVEIDRHRRMAAVGRGLRASRGKRPALDPHAGRPSCQNFGVRIVRRVSRSGWSATSSSNTILRAVLARSVAVFTFMPAAGLRMQLAASTRSPSISTMQARQLPSADSRARARSTDAGCRCRGACATCQMVSPARASTSRPSSVNVIGFIVVIGSHHCPAACQILAEILEHAAQRIGRRLAEAADRGVAHRGGQLVQQRLVPRPGCHQLDGLLGADAAGRALAAAFVLEEPHQVERHRLHVVLLGQDDNRVRADEAAVFFQRAEIERHRRPSSAGRMPPEAPPGR